MKESYIVQPTVVWTKDRNQAYVDGADAAFTVVRDWFLEKSGHTFNLEPADAMYWPPGKPASFYGIATSIPCDENEIIYLLVVGADVGGGTYGGKALGCPYSTVPGRACGSGGSVAVMAGLDPEEEGFPPQPWFHNELHEIHGSIAHEIGHCVGMPHPEDRLTTFMGSQWHLFPDQAISDAEMKVIRKSPFFHPSFGKRRKS